MALLLHLFAALSSIVFTTYTYITPSARKLRASYLSVVLTLLSGFYLVVQTHSSLLSSCITGLGYLAFVGFEIVAAQRKLARVPADHL